MTARKALGLVIREAACAVADGATTREIAEAALASISRADYTAYLLDAIESRVASEVGHGRTQVTPARSSLSTKQALIRDQYWPRFLNQMIALPSGYKRLGSATVDDLTFLAQMRRSQANDLRAKAEQFEALAALMQKHGATFLEELDSSTGEGALAA